jgi:flagellar hook-associated protein 3 FlgL
MMMNAALNDLSGLREKYAKAQALVNGKALERPSEDPQRVVEAMDLSEAKMRLERSQRSGEDATQWLSASENSLTAMIEELQNARETAVQAGSPTNKDPGAQESLAKTFLAIRDAVVRELNTQHRDQYLFAGWKTDVKPFDLTPGDPNGGVTYTADSDGESTRDIAPGLAVTVNVPGRQLTAKGDFISTLSRMADDLRNGRSDAVTTDRLNELSAGLNNLIDIRSDLGIRQQQVAMYGNLARDNLFNLEQRLTTISGGDLESSVLQMTQAQANYQAALSAFSKSMPTSLLDYMMR